MRLLDSEMHLLEVIAAQLAQTSELVYSRTKSIIEGGGAKIMLSVVTNPKRLGPFRS